jgi:hypothetical protein
MKLYLVYFLDYQSANNEQAIIKGSFLSLEEANENIKTITLNYITEQQGKQQAQICEQYDKTLEQIMNDITLKDGMYIRKEKEIMTIYNKIIQVVPGTFLWSSSKTEIKKIMTIKVTEFECPLFEKEKATDNSSNLPSVKKVDLNKNYTFLEELNRFKENIKSQQTGRLLPSKIKQELKENKKSRLTDSIENPISEELPKYEELPNYEEPLSSESDLPEEIQNLVDNPLYAPESKSENDIYIPTYYARYVENDPIKNNDTA